MDFKDRNNIFYAVISYLGILFLLASFITIGIGIIICAKNHLNFFELYESFVVTDFTEISPQIQKASAITQAYGNLISYVLSFVLVVLFLRKYLVEDFSKIKENPTKFIAYSVSAGIIFIFLSLVIDIAFSYIVDPSQNQNNIEMIMENGGAIPMILAVVFFAPIVEELIYRKAIFKLNENGSKVKSYVISIVFFTLPHMLSTDISNIFTWFLQCIPYAACGFMLCYIYEKSNYNIYAVIVVHMMNNILAAALMFI
jgi:membrane protease YdiL (CAAX protease family)